MVIPFSVVAQTVDVPRMDINIEGNKIVADKINYLDATISITGNGYCPDFDATDVQIRGRGNSSWSTPRIGKDSQGKDSVIYNPKNPYRLKFKKKQSLAGLKKGKNWVLLSNPIDRSMLTNAYGMAAARIVGTLAANDIIPIDLYINGDYRGNYNLTEKVGISANSIDVDDESNAVLLELDTYFDEVYKFKDSYYPNLPVMIKDPDLSEDETNITLNQVCDSFALFTKDLKAGKDISSRVDTTMLAKYLLVNFLVYNQELLHPKSTYIFRERLNDSSSKWQFGPVWDLDFAYAHEMDLNYANYDYKVDFFYDPSNKMENSSFWKDIFSIPSVKKAYANEWRKFMNGGLDSLLNYCREYYKIVRPSIYRDIARWNRPFDYDDISERMINWISNRAKYLAPDAIANKIDAVYVPKLNDGKVYTIDGILIGSLENKDINSLPSGIYIINGKKTILSGRN